MSTKKPAKRPRMDVRDDPKSGWERYCEGATEGASVETFFGHADRNGNVWLLSESSARLTPERRSELRERIIASNMAIENLIMLGSPATVAFRYYPSREEAEQKADLALGIWPPARIICSAMANAVDVLDERFGVKVPASKAA